MDIAADDLRQRCFLSLAVLGALYLAAVTLRLLDCLGLPSLLRRPTNLRRRYGAWAVVTGPTSGIGRSMALELARRGLSVVLIGRDPDRLCDISDAITRNHAVQTKTVVFDLSLVSTTQGDEAMRRLREAVEGLDVGVLVNNAGVAKPCAVYLHEFDVEAWMRMVRVNLWALTEVAAAVLPGMAARGRGAVVNIGSGSTEAIPSFPLYTVYAATKRSPGAFTLNTEAKGLMCNARPRCSWTPRWRLGSPGPDASRRSCRRPTRTRGRRCAGSGTARSACPTPGTGSSGASPPRCRTASTTGSACASTSGSGRSSSGSGPQGLHRATTTRKNPRDTSFNGTIGLACLTVVSYSRFHCSRLASRSRRKGHSAAMGKI
ncbi:hypothetical protein PAHAL_4G221700 [Panicum hallii]|uniref:Uncharacterized protein n=2 Tax=Panicum hallii TaxID=206008 RepID=A0A2S3HJL0_9POAL|nr:very-long-chain 3-oxoacyl-CoA reductase 1-like isoform X1 [Panicum hallii]PAN24456.1 hypothetical protein PAHAL_4G221700 [Panicum hallii]